MMRVATNNAGIHNHRNYNLDKIFQGQPKTKPWINSSSENQPESWMIELNLCAQDVFVKSPGLIIRDEILPAIKDVNSRNTFVVTFSLMYTNQYLLNIWRADCNQGVMTLIYQFMHEKQPISWIKKHWSTRVWLHQIHFTRFQAL